MAPVTTLTINYVTKRVPLFVVRDIMEESRTRSSNNTAVVAGEEGGGGYEKKKFIVQRNIGAYKKIIRRGKPAGISYVFI